MGAIASTPAKWAGWVLVLVGAAGVSAAAACGGDDDTKARGSGGSAGAAGWGGASGNPGSGGSAGKAGTGGNGGTAGDGGSDASAGAAGTAGGPSEGGADSDAGASTYVDCVNGLDTNNGFEATPFKTLAKAASGATSGSTIWVLDGVCDRNTEPAFNEPGGAGIEIPNGVSLRAKNSGQVTFSGADDYRSAAVRFLGSGAVQGVRFQTFSNAIVAFSGTLTVTDVLFDDIYPGTPLNLAGTVQATLTPGGVTNYIGNDQTMFAYLLGRARLTLLGGTIRGAKDSGVSGLGMFLLREQSQLVLDGVTLENNQHSGVVVLNSASAVVRNNTIIRNTASVACCNQASIRVGDTARLELLDSTITAAPVPAIVLTAGTPNVLLRNAAVTGGARYAISTAIHSDASPTIVIQNSRLNDNGGGVYLDYAATLNVSGSEISRNGAPTECGAGIWLSALPVHNLLVRSTKIEGNCRGGAIVGGGSGSVLDFGRGSSPGGNTLTGNSPTANLGNLSVELQASGIVYASGNVWEPGVQGAAIVGSADPQPGRYKVTGGAALNVTGLQTGRNYAIIGTYATSTTLRLAENP